MDLQRQEYPSMLAHLQPAQATKLLSDRLNLVRAVNVDVADWLQERRRIEETYAVGLRKLSLRPLGGDNSDLGVFTSPWQKIIEATSTLAQSHHNLSQNIGVDVEAPLRDFTSMNREMQNISTMTGNIQSIAKEFENANKRADKLKDKGGKAAADKVANAASSVEDAKGQWDSQAPYVFEKLQAVDEARLDHLRNCLTQFQTHVIEANSSVSSGAEECLNALLNVQTSDEIQRFSMRAPSSATTRARERRQSRSQPVSAPTTSSLAPPSIPLAATTEDAASQRSSSFQERPKSKFGGLKRLGTVIKGRRQSTHPYGHNLSPERKRSSSNITSKIGNFGKRSKEGSSSLSPQPTGELQSAESAAPTSRPSDSAPSPILERVSSDIPNGKAPDLPRDSEAGPSLVNGNLSSSTPRVGESIPRPISPAGAAEVAKDAESTPPLLGSDAIAQALNEAAMVNEGSQPQFKLDIRNAPIQEEDGDASAAMANVALTLRSQAAPRRNVTVRGRRDRNTIILPSPSVPELPWIAAAAAASTSSLPSSPTPQAAQTTPIVQPAPFKLSHMSSLGAEESAASDTHSIRSGRSFSSSVSTTIKHPELHEPGLNSSIVETVSAWSTAGAITRAIQIGEVALAYNPVDGSEPASSETIRLENFSTLEKVAPNPQFIDALPDKEGMYSVNLSQLSRTTVAFKYQVHLDQTTLVSHAPILITPAWKVEPTQTFVRLSYSLNPEFARRLPEGTTSLTLSNVILILHLDPEGAPVQRCQAAGGGLYARERNLVYWRLNEVTLSRDAPSQLLRAKFFTESEAKPGTAEARWEITGDQLATWGGICISRRETATSDSEVADPFADESAAPTPTVAWKEVTAVRRLRSGSYVAS